MVRQLVSIVFFLFYLHGFVICALSHTHENLIERKVLNVGEELWKETLPLQKGSRLYELQGLKSSSWYEVKISYPASIPASFAIQLVRSKLETGFNSRRRLLNTEKLIFKADESNLIYGEDGICVLVTVEPAGIVAIPHLPDRQFVVFNIVCDELLLGIPHKAWWVGILVFLCLGLAFVVPYFLPSHLLHKYQSLQSGKVFLDNGSKGFSCRSVMSDDVDEQNKKQIFDESNL